jgi:hypothetical protein
LAAAAALLASVGVANAQGPVTLTDGQLDKATAGDTVTAASTADLNRLVTITNWTLALLNGVPLSANGASLSPNGVPLSPLSITP